MSSTLLEMRKVTKRFPGVIALNEVSIELKQGEILAICGENGAGKSTLMKVLSGSYTHNEYEGQLLVNGGQVTFSNVADAQKAGIEMVYQEMNMMLDATIAENIFVGNLPGKYGFVNYKKLYRDTEEMLKIIHLNLAPDTIVRNLNSGQMQMLAIVRAIAKNPAVLVLDEPTSALTDQETDILMSLMQQLKKKNISCLFISHRLEEVFRIADRIAVMRDGKNIWCRNVNEVTQKELVEAMVGRKIENMYPPKADSVGEEILRVEHLTVPHPTVQNKNILEDISFSLNKGEILGLGGLVGAGRSELLGAIFGQLTRGVTKQVTIHNEPAEIHSPKDAIRHRIGFVTEERKKSGFVWVFSIRENLSLASLKKIPKKHFIDKAYEKEFTGKMFERLKIKAPSLETVIINLSGGNQQKVVLGKWLLEEPDILLIDEPTKGIDVGAKAEIYKIMRQLTAEGYSIIMASSDMPELVSMSDRCIVLSNGKITGEFAGQEITQDKVLTAALMQ